MNESEFNEHIDKILMNIEDCLDATDLDVDIENNGGVLTLIFENQTQIIVNRQTPTRQIWVASRSGGYHLDYYSEQDIWQQNGVELFELLSRECTVQAGEPVNLQQS